MNCLMCLVGFLALSIGQVQAGIFDWVGPYVCAISGGENCIGSQAAVAPAGGQENIPVALPSNFKLLKKYHLHTPDSRQCCYLNTYDYGSYAVTQRACLEKTLFHDQMFYTPTGVKTDCPNLEHSGAGKKAFPETYKMLEKKFVNSTQVCMGGKIKVSRSYYPQFSCTTTRLPWNSQSVDYSSDELSSNAASWIGSAHCVSSDFNDDHNPDPADEYIAGGTSACVFPVMAPALYAISNQTGAIGGDLSNDSERNSQPMDVSKGDSVPVGQEKVSPQ